MTCACSSAERRPRPTWPPILDEVGWKGNLEDLDRAAATADITVVEIAPGTRLPYMSSRKNRKPHALMDVLWAGRKPIQAFTFEFSSNCVRYRFRVPHACGNFWIEELGKDDDRPEVRPATAAAGRLRERRRRDLRHAAGRVRGDREEPARRQQREPLRERQGARLATSSRDGTFKFTFAGAPTPGHATRSRRSRAA